MTTTVTANNTSSADLDGGLGNDFLQGTLGNDTLNGGAGNDTASFVNAFSGGSTTGVTVDLNTQGVAQNTVAAGTDTLTGIENLVGSALNDTLTGDGNDNVIEGGLGNDVLVGGVGVDTASYAGASAGVTVSLAAQGIGPEHRQRGNGHPQRVREPAGLHIQRQPDGRRQREYTFGRCGRRHAEPGRERDRRRGPAGRRRWLRHSILRGSAAAVTATLNGAIDGTATIGGVNVATLRSIENLLGGAGADILTGDSNANVIDGGLGDDTLNGGAGVDTISFASNGAAGVTVNLATLTAQNTGCRQRHHPRLRERPRGPRCRQHHRRRRRQRLLRKRRQRRL